MPPITPITVNTVGNSGTVTLAAQNLPAGLTFTDNGNGTGTISGTLAGGTAVGSPYPIIVTATDTSGQEDSEVITVVVNPSPRAPNAVGLSDPTAPANALTNWRPASLASIARVKVVGPDLLALLDPDVSSTATISLVDISNPAAPVEVGVINGPARDGATAYVINSGGSSDKCLEADFAGQRLFVGGGGGVAAYDISDPTTPTFIAGNSQASGLGMAFNGTYLLSLNGNSALPVAMFDTDLNLLGTSAFPNLQSVDSITCEGRFFVAVDSANRFTVHEVEGGAFTQWADSGTAFASGLYLYPRTVWTGATSFVVLARPQSLDTRVYLYAFDLDGVAQGATSLSAVGNLTTSAPAFSNGSSWSANFPYADSSCADLNGIVYIITSLGLMAFDVSTPTAPTVASKIELALGTATGVDVTNGKLVFASQTGIYIYT